MYRRTGGILEVLLVHPGGPYFARRDAGWWSIPKGLVDGDEDPLAAARREFTEETSLPARSPVFTPLGEVRQKGGKRVLAWAFEGDCDPGAVASNTFEMEWPPRSGRRQSFPEVDRAAWFPVPEARVRMNAAQAGFLERLEEHLGAGEGPQESARSS